MRSKRRTREEMDTLRSAIYDVAKTDRPVSVRHIFYRMVTQDLVEKSDRGYERGYRAGCRQGADGTEGRIVNKKKPARYNRFRAGSSLGGRPSSRSRV